MTPHMDTPSNAEIAADSPRSFLQVVRNRLAGRHVGATRSEVLLEELLKCIFCRHYLELRHGFAPAQIRALDDDALLSWLRRAFDALKAAFPSLYPATEDLELADSEILAIARGFHFPVLDTATDPIADAFEVFVGADARGHLGQYFTPRSVAELLVSALAPTLGEHIIDPACGTGSFLAAVARHWLASGATPDEIAQAAGHVSGIDKDAYLLKLANIHLSMMMRASPQLLLGDALALRNADGASIAGRVPLAGFDVVISNPPFGKRIAADPEVLAAFALARHWRTDGARMAATKRLRRSVPPQVLFVERCIGLLRPGGRLGMVVPESLVSNRSYRYVVQYLRTHCDVEAVIGMPDVLFKTSGKGGTHTKTCIVIARRHNHSNDNNHNRGHNHRHVFMAEAKWCGHDSRARAIPHNDLPTIAARLRDYRRGRAIDTSPLGFPVPSERLDSGILCPRYYDPSVDAMLATLTASHDIVSVAELVERGIVSLATGDEPGKLAYGTGEIPFVRTSDLSNWQIHSHPKQCIDRAFYDELSDKQDVRAGDILMVKDGSYLIGNCAIITEHDTEIVYQSHLYKIRVHANNIDLNAYLLLAILSSRTVQRQVRAKQFTQDIIDSLGARIRELMLPIPRDAAQRARITDLVEQSISARTRARLLAREARVAVLETD